MKSLSSFSTVLLTINISLEVMGICHLLSISCLAYFTLSPALSKGKCKNPNQPQGTAVTNTCLCKKNAYCKTECCYEMSM